MNVNIDKNMNETTNINTNESTLETLNNKSEILLKDVAKRFYTKKLGEVVAVENLNLDIKTGECFSFLGPSGCGKTTSLRMIAGFEDLSEGEIYLSGKLVSSSKKHKYIPPEERGLGMVFQAFAVWPHMNVFDNVAFPLKVQKRPSAEIRERVAKALKHTSLDGLEKVYPSDLSGGEQQRIALARAIVTNPRVLLLDEPLSNLDPHLRETMRFEIKNLQKEFGFTIIFVTHDQSEAMAISDRMMVMDMGHQVQIGSPEELYNRPINRFVHSFLGESSFTEVTVENGKVYIEGEKEALPISAPKGTDGKRLIGTRPNTVEILPGKQELTTDHVYGKVSKRIFLPDFSEYIVQVGEQFIKVQSSHHVYLKEGDSCTLRLPGIMWYEAEDEATIRERNRRQLV